MTLRGSPLAAQPRGQELARAALARLDALEARLSDEHIEDQTLWDWLPYSDGVSAEHLRRNRPALLARDRRGRERYRALLDALPRAERRSDLPLAPDPVRVAQLALVELAVRVARQGRP